MAFDPDDLPAPKPVLGRLPADLSRLSIAELETVIATLEGEIARCRSAITAKQSTRVAADSIFKR